MTVQVDHLTYGFYTSSGKKISTTSIYFESLPYKVSSTTGYIDYDRLEEKALDFGPKLIICSGSAYPRDWDYAKFSSIADKCGALLFCDMAHISGLVAAQEAANPFEYCDIVTTTTHTHQTAALAVALKKAMVLGFKAYAKQVKANAKQVKANAVALGNYLMSKGYKLVTGGAENHLVLWDLRPLGSTGHKVKKLCDLCNITVNKNAVFGDSSALAPGGVRIGVPALTSRSLVEKDFEQIAEFLHGHLSMATLMPRITSFQIPSLWFQNNNFLTPFSNDFPICGF